jgi:membrane protein
LTTHEHGGFGGKLIAVTKAVLLRNKQHGLNDIAAGLSFWAIVSVFPAALAFASLLGSLELFIGKSAADQARQDIVDFLNRTLPPGSEITSTIDNILHQSRAGLAIVGLVSAAWGMSKGFAGLIRGLTVVDGRPGARYGLKGRIVGLVLGAATVAVMVIVLLQIIVGPLLGFERLLPEGGSALLTVWEGVRWPVLAVLIVIWLATLFQIGPGPIPGRRWRDRLPGAVATAVMWTLVTFGFKLYVSVVGGANPILGVLGGAIVSLTWVYLLSFSTLLGAELNAALADQRAPAAAMAAAGTPAIATNGRRATNGLGAANGAGHEASPAMGAGIVAAALLLGRRRR